MTQSTEHDELSPAIDTPLHETPSADTVVGVEAEGDDMDAAIDGIDSDAHEADEADDADDDDDMNDVDELDDASVDEPDAEAV